LASLHQATFEGDLEQMLVLIEQIREEQLAKALASLANNLQYKELLALTHLETPELRDIQPLTDRSIYLNYGLLI
jgi:hypothetical protein